MRLQQEIVSAQCASYGINRAHCPGCGQKLRCRARGKIRYRSVFGDVTAPSPRFCHCHCQKGSAKTFSPLAELLPDHIAPEFLWLETKWASLASSGITADILKDVLPIDARFSPDTIRRHLGTVATRREAELAEERTSFIETSAFQRAQMPNPEGEITVGIDGGYVRSRDVGPSHFDVMVGKSIPTDRTSRYPGLVQSHDDKPKRRLHEVLKAQGWQEIQPVTFITDGGDTVINMALRMAPAPDQRVLWSGNLNDAQAVIADMVVDLEDVETDDPSLRALRKAASEFETYIANNKAMIPSYAERRRYGERVPTGFVESTVNTVVGKRFRKRT